SNPIGSSQATPLAGDREVAPSGSASPPPDTAGAPQSGERAEQIASDRPADSGALAVEAATPPSPDGADAGPASASPTATGTAQAAPPAATANSAPTAAQA